MINRRRRRRKVSLITRVKTLRDPSAFDRLEEAYTEGYEKGFSEGKDEGHIDGHDEGYQEGKADRRKLERRIAALEEYIKWMERLP